jgi:hypothetical protein
VFISSLILTVFLGVVEDKCCRKRFSKLLLLVDDLVCLGVIIVNGGGGDIGCGVVGDPSEPIYCIVVEDGDLIGDVVDISANKLLSLPLLQQLPDTDINTFSLLVSRC